MMSTPYLLILAAIAAACIYFAKRKSAPKNDFKELTTDSSERIIRVYDMTEAQLQASINDFKELYSEIVDVELPSVVQEDKVFRLSFSHDNDFVLMRYWFNHLAFPDGKRKHRHHVCGWYPFGEVKLNGKPQPYSNQTVMLFVDKNMKECDNVSFVTPDGNYYLWQFADDSVKPVDTGSETYRPL